MIPYNNIITHMNQVRNSCGALFYTFNEENELGIILGKEYDNYTPCKGKMEHGEIAEESAIREIAEESNNIVVLDGIDLYFTQKKCKKTYYFGLCYVPFLFIEYYNENKERVKEAEKDHFSFFKIEDVISNQFDVKLVPDFVVNATRFFESYMMFPEDPNGIAIIEILNLRKYNAVKYA